MKIFISFFALLFFPWPLSAAVSFTGFANQDFPAEACMADPGGQDVGMPVAFPNTEISGFDLTSVCYSYDPTNDTLYIGLQTFLSASNTPIIFGDADGDGNPSSASQTLTTLLGSDFADLASSEFITLVLDMNADGAPDAVVGVNTGNALAQFAVKGSVAAPNNHLLLAPLDLFYGGALAGVTTSNAHLPSADKPHLEFSLTGIKNIPGYASLDFTNPNSFFQLYLTTGSLGDDGISEEYFPNIATYQKMVVGCLTDAESDTVNDCLDSDDDNDTLADIIEGAPSTDTDGDGTPDYLDADSDNDGLLDKFEAGANPPRDSDGDGIYDFRELDSDADGLLDAEEDIDLDGVLDPGETDPSKFDTDGDGLCDGTLVVFSCTGSEVIVGTDPQKVDSDGDGLCDGSIIVPPCTNAEGNPVAAAASTTLGGDVDLSQGAVRLQGGGCSMLPGVASFPAMFAWVFLVLGLGIVPRVWGVSGDHYRSATNRHGFLNDESAQVLEVKKYNFGVSQHLAHRSLEFGRVAGGRFVDNVINYFYVWDLWGAVGVYKDVEVGFHFPVSLVTQIEDISSSVERNTTTLGDLRLQAKWRVLDYLGVQGFIDIPTGNSAEFLGESATTGGLKILAEKKWGGHELGGHLGFFGRGTEQVVASGTTLLDVGPEMMWGVGWRYRFQSPHQWAVASHLWGRTDFASEATSPTEWDFGLSKGLKKLPLELMTGFGFGIGKGYGAPRYRLMIALSYKEKEKQKVQEKLVQLEEKEIVVLKPIHFDSDTATLKKESLPILDEVATLLQNNQTILKVRIEGHTDADASENYNAHLSQARADAVKNYLVEQGVAPKRLLTKGWGESQPISLNDSPSAKSQNRRVEFHVVEVER